MTELKENPLGLSWHNSAWIPILNPANIMEYFCDRSNPFYDRTCNNEVVKMQRINPDQINNMSGVEYTLLHVQEPILYVIRKQIRHSPNQVSPIADYYIVAGIVYQAPDLCTVINSRLLSTVNHLQSAFDEALTYSRYHPSKGYWWEFKEKGPKENVKDEEEKQDKKDEPSSIFQRQRVDMLLGELAKKFGPKHPQPPAAPPPVTSQANATQSQNSPSTVQSSDQKSQNKDEVAKLDVKIEIKQEKSSSNMKPPPDKKPRLE